MFVTEDTTRARPEDVRRLYKHGHRVRREPGLRLRHRRDTLRPKESTRLIRFVS